MFLTNTTSAWAHQQVAAMARSSWGRNLLRFEMIDFGTSCIAICTLHQQSWIGWSLELITFEILAAERLRLMGFDNRLIIDCFSNVVNILICCHIGKLCARVPCPRHWWQMLRSQEGSLGFGPHRPVGIFVCIDGKDCEKDALVG